MKVFQSSDCLAADKRQAVFAQFAADAINFAVGELGEHEHRFCAVRDDAEPLFRGEPRDEERRRRGRVDKNGIAVLDKFRGTFADLPLCVGVANLGDSLAAIKNACSRIKR